MTVSVQVDLGTLARVGTALADPTRRRVLVHLIDGPGYPAEMADEFGTSRANLSNHLTCLRECGLVTATAEGRRVGYELGDQRLAEGLRIPPFQVGDRCLRDLAAKAASILGQAALRSRQDRGERAWAAVNWS